MRDQIASPARIGDTSGFIEALDFTTSPCAGDVRDNVRQLDTRPCSILELLPNPQDVWEPLRTRLAESSPGSVRVFANESAIRLVERGAGGGVAVVVPMHNAERFIRETLASIRSQAYPGVYAIVVDDASSDRSVQATVGSMSDYPEFPVILAVAPRLGTAGTVRNFALYNCLLRGTQFVAFMDADDLYASRSAISDLAEVLRRDDECFAVYGDYDWMSENGSSFTSPSALIWRRSEQRLDWHPDRVLNWLNVACGNIGVFHLQTLLIRARAGLPFFSYRLRGEDMEFYSGLFALSAARYEQSLRGIRQHPAVVAHYRVRSGSVTAKALVRPSGGVRANVPPQGSSWQTAEETSRRTGVPKFLVHAGAPASCLNARVVSAWYCQRRLRQAQRQLQRGNLAGVLREIRAGLRDRRILPGDLSRTFARMVRFELARMRCKRFCKLEVSSRGWMRDPVLAHSRNRTPDSA